jgi:signal peptidase I
MLTTPHRKNMKVWKIWHDWIRPILVILLITTTFRSAIADWNDVPTGSMKPTILEGDRIFVNKVAYSLRIPFTTVSLADWRNPVRGDIVVFLSPVDGRRLVKRVVGIPGDQIRLRNNALYVNGRKAEYKDLEPSVISDIPLEERLNYNFATESVSGLNHAVMITPGNRSIRNFRAMQVPEGHYFVMGDNRDNSFDSRYFGPVPRNRILGRALGVVASLDLDDRYLPRWKRFLTALR